ncbi:LOW QUALITY PROTEIN: gamma-glutamylcyclotransferase-like [Liolophura sinensis]|uniref:LOW QUALITY PROTEIN: gamma-glutamylcyclotransferase-like n=1 Tax=Liolophura sinensis TaxID=3198878 RepID=UPI003158D762
MEKFGVENDLVKARDRLNGKLRLIGRILNTQEVNLLQRMVFLYFAYGSNLLRQRLLCNQSGQLKRFKGVGKLQDYELRFKGYTSKSWSGHPATIEACPGSDVWGVVWELEDQLAQALDEQEKSYAKFSVSVTLQSGMTVDCVTYQMQKRTVEETGVPSPQYLDVIRRGARQNGLPSEYRDWLDRQPHNNNPGPVPLYRKVMDLIQNDPSCNQDIDKLT